MQVLDNLKNKFEISFIYKQIKDNKNISFLIILNIFILTIVEMFVLSSLLPIVNLFSDNQKIVILKDIGIS